MNGQIRTFLGLAGAVLLAAGTMAAQGKPNVPPPAAAQPRPNDEAPPPTKLVAPERGQAELGITRAAVKRDGKFVVTTIKVKNLATGAIAGLKVDEFWYDKKGDPVTGAAPFRYRKPLQPGEVIEITLRTPVHPQMDRSNLRFEHANGTIKTTVLPKL
jgi:hypothetical protein